MKSDLNQEGVMPQRRKAILYWAELLAMPKLAGVERKMWCVFSLGLLILLASLGSLACRPDSLFDRALRAGGARLDLAHVVRRKLATGEHHSYLIPLVAGQYLRLQLEQKGIDVGLSIYRPDGRLATEYEGRADGRAAISLLAEIEGEYRLESYALEIETCTGSYQIKVEEKRTATPQDQKRIAGELAFADGERLRSKSKIEASREAITKYQEAEQHWRAAGQNQEVVKALRASGQIHHQLGKPHQALAQFKTALLLSQESQSAEQESDILSDVSNVHLHLGDYWEALKYANRALGTSKIACDESRETQALLSISEVYYGFGDRWKALEYSQRASSLSQHTGDRRKQAQALLSLGFLYTDLGETQQAAGYFDQALALYRAVEDIRGQALTRAATATLKVITGEGQLALTMYQEARTAIQAAGDRYWEASILQNMGALYQYLGKSDKVLAYFTESREIWKEIENPAEESGALSVIGWLYSLDKNYELALKNLEEALSLSEALSDKKYQSNVLSEMGAVYNALGKKGRALSYYQKALALHKANGERQAEAKALNEIGKLYHSLHRTSQARSYLEQALAIDRARGDRFAESETLYQLARLEADSGHFAIARTYVESALKIIETLRGNVTSQKLRVTYFASIQRYFEFLESLLMRQDQRQPGLGFEARALEVSERARARSLLELLTEASANIRQVSDPALVEQARQLQNQLSTVVERKIRMIETKAPASEITAVSREIDTLSEKRDQIESLVRNKNPHYAALTLPKPLQASEIQQLLDENTLLLEFSLGDKQSYVWSVTPTGVKGHDLKDRAEIEKLTREVREILAPDESAPVELDATRTEAYWKKAAELSQLILGPVADELGQKRLVIVADGVLQYIPFGALPKPQAGGKPLVGKKSSVASTAYIPLIQEHEIVSLPSASTLAVLRQETAGRKPAPKTIAVLADPVFATNDLRLLAVNGQANGALPSQPALGDLTSQLRNQSQRRGRSFKRLQWTLDEATAIEELTQPGDRFVAKGFDATLQQATDPNLSQFRIIHFATHGVLDDENPELSALVFSLFDKQGKTLEGRLWLNDIYNLNLPAELVVLSACDTGLGKEFKGEGLVGLTRGFMYAGAPRVMASLWKVEDKPTAQLMRHFYWHLLKKGLPPATALRQAQLDLFRDAKWNAPYYWGSFVLQGEWK